MHCPKWPIISAIILLSFTSSTESHNAPSLTMYYLENNIFLHIYWSRLHPFKRSVMIYVFVLCCFSLVMFLHPVTLPILTWPLSPVAYHTHSPNPCQCPAAATQAISSHLKYPSPTFTLCQTVSSVLLMSSHSLSGFLSSVSWTLFCVSFVYLFSVSWFGLPMSLCSPPGFAPARLQTHFTCLASPAFCVSDHALASIMLYTVNK